MLGGLGLYLRLWLWKHQVLLVTLATGTVTVLCFFVIPIEIFGSTFLSPEGRTVGQIRGRSLAFGLTYLVGTVNSIAFLVLAVELIFPEEWVAADSD